MSDIPSDVASGAGTDPVEATSLPGIVTISGSWDFQGMIDTLSAIAVAVNNYKEHTMGQIDDLNEATNQLGAAISACADRVAALVAGDDGPNPDLAAEIAKLQELGTAVSNIAPGTPVTVPDPAPIDTTPVDETPAPVEPAPDDTSAA